MKLYFPTQSAFFERFFSQLLFFVVVLFFVIVLEVWDCTFKAGDATV